MIKTARGKVITGALMLESDSKRSSMTAAIAEIAISVSYAADWLGRVAASPRGNARRFANGMEKPHPALFHKLEVTRS